MAVTDALAAVAGAVYDNNDIYNMPCNTTLPDLVLTIGSTRYAIKSDNLISQVSTYLLNSKV